MAEQLVGKLDENSVHKNAKVEEIKNVEDGAVEVRVNMVNKEGQKTTTTKRGKKCILAVEGPECDRLLGTKDKQREKGVGTTCVYFSCDKPYDAKNPMLYLDGEKYKGSKGGRKRRQQLLLPICCLSNVRAKREALVFCLHYWCSKRTFGRTNRRTSQIGTLRMVRRIHYEFV